MESYQIYQWLVDHNLVLVLQMTETVIMDIKTLKNIAFDVDGTEIQPIPQLKYPGIWLDHRQSFQLHVEEATRVFRSRVFNKAHRRKQG